MSGARILEILIESHRSVLLTHGIDPATLPVEEMARNAAGILHAELQAEEAEREEGMTTNPVAWTEVWNKERESP